MNTSTTISAAGSTVVRRFRFSLSPNMWGTIGAFILRYRIPIAVVMLLITAYMGYMAQFVRMNYKFSGVLPHDDSTYVDYERFISQFSEDGNVLAVGFKDPQIWKFENFLRWKQLGDSLHSIQVPVTIKDESGKRTEMRGAVDSVFSAAHCYTLVRNDSLERFDFVRLGGSISSQADVDSLHEQLYNLPFYEDILYRKATDAGLMMVFVNKEIFDSNNRGDAVDRMVALCDGFTASTGIKTYVSGLPFIRDETMKRVKGELNFFTALSAIICVVLLYIFFRSFKVIIIVMSVVAVGVVWAMGSIALFDYPLTALMGLMPPLMIVTSVPNCIYLVTKYHQEFKRYGNKTRALTRVVQKAGLSAFMINATTAVGFATFIFTSSDLLVHFGVIATLNSMGVFFLSLIIFPIVSFYLPPPTEKHLDHLDSRWLEWTLDGLVRIVSKNRRLIYVITAVSTVAGLIGISLMHTTGNIVDDLPEDDRVITDLHWFEQNFNGVMPFEIMVDAQRKGQITQPKNQKKIEELQQLMAGYTLELKDTTIKPFSRSVSIVDAGKFIRQAFYDGEPSRYDLIQKNEQSFIGPYVEANYESRGMEHTFMDSTRARTRISAHIADIGTKEMDRMLKDIRPRIDSIFDPEKFDVTLTGTSIVFVKGTSYLVKDLFSSLLFGVIIISILMAIMFWSFRMVLISFVPNVIPQIMTAGIMGYLNIPLKPSTILVFSIALGISVDNTIHYLAKYRQELKFHNWKIRESALLAIRETGASMVYTSLVLLFGFGCFAASEFEGSRALGVLTAVTLLVAMFTNLIVLPSLLLSFQRSITTQSFKEPFFQMMDEEDELHYTDWEIRKMEGNVD
ncbi:MAG: MMPL family transporter [Flavobacteriales bacterium]|nr:MMPL family transporter [Flavobacteriales bacterium]